ncbi:MAG: flagellar biosynthesis regulator FlaF [Jannaschia sp.]
MSLAHSAAAAAYGALDPNLVSPMRAEALVFSGVTRRMEAVFADPDSSPAAKAGVLHDNRRLWLAAATATADGDNQLPDALRASIIGLAAFVDRQTSDILRGKGTAGILSEINRRVIGGLSSGAR